MDLGFSKEEKLAYATVLTESSNPLIIIAENTFILCIMHI